jgi:orotate phosphoribosyltransferase
MHTDVATATAQDLLEAVGMLDREKNPHRSSPLSHPLAFKELTSRLAAEVDTAYDIIVVRDLFGDRVLGYQLSILSGKPVAISYDEEGIIFLENSGAVDEGSKILIAADTHFTTHSIQAAARGAEQAGMSVAGAAIFLQVVRGEYSFPVWSLERPE